NSFRFEDKNPLRKTAKSFKMALNNFFRANAGAQGSRSVRLVSTPTANCHFNNQTRPGLGNHGLSPRTKIPVFYLKPNGNLLVFCMLRYAVRVPLGPGGDGRRRCPTP